MATTTITLVEAGRFGAGWAAVVERTRTGWLLVVDTGADHRRAVELGGAVDRCGRPVELDEIERRGYGALDRLADELEPSAARSPVQSGPAGPVDGACDDCGSPGRPVPGVYLCLCDRCLADLGDDDDDDLCGLDADLDDLGDDDDLSYDNWLADGGDDDGAEDDGTPGTGEPAIWFTAGYRARDGHLVYGEWQTQGVVISSDPGSQLIEVKADGATCTTRVYRDAVFPAV